MRSRGGAFALLLAAASGSLTARAEEAKSITLAEALRLAEERSPDLQAAQARAAAQSERASALGNTALPRIGIGLGWSYTDNPSYVFAHKLNAGEFTQADFAIDNLNAPSGLAHLTSVLSVEAPLDLAGRVRDQSGAQAAGAKALSEAAREARLETRLRVVEAYRRAHLAALAIDVTERARAAAAAREADIDARVSEGAALEAERLRARARRRQREAELAERRADLATALAGLSRAIGADPAVRFVPAEAAAAPEPLTDDLAAWQARSQKQRPTLTAAGERLNGARLGRRAEGRSAWPELGAYAQLQDDRNSFSNGGQSITVGAALRWSVFDASRGRRAAAAALDERAAQEDARASRDQVSFEVEAAYRRAVAARERHAAAGGGALEGREALRVVRERRQAGLATLTDELDTEAAALAAELAEIHAATEAALADAALRRAAGEL